MIKIIKELNIEVSKPNIFQAVVAKQYDMNTRFIKATFVDGSEVISIPKTDTVRVVINAEMPDGTKAAYEGEVNDDGTVTVPLHSEMLRIDGTVICDISVIDTVTDDDGDDKKLTTTAFTLLVEKAAYGGSDITSDPQYDVLVSLLETCSEANANAEEALGKSNEALRKSAEADSKYDACVEATENANNVLQDIQAGGYIESLKELNKGSKFSTWIGTKAEYESLPEIIPNCLYILTDETSSEEILAQLKALEEEVQKNVNAIEALEEEVEAHTSDKTNAYPVGSIWVGGKDSKGNKINPADLFGGSWTLIDKEFKSQAISESDNGGKMFRNSSPDFEQSKPFNSYEIYAILAGHTIRFRFKGAPSFEMTSDTSYIMGTIVLSSLGITSLHHGIYSVPFMGDGGNGLIMANIEPDGTFKVNDTIKDTTAGGGLFMNEEITCKYDNMLDSFCDKFYWKRTA